MPAGEPPYAQNQTHPPQAHEAYSEAPGDARNRAAQASHAAAHHVEPNQNVQNKNASKSKRFDEAHLASLVAEENATKSKFPHYPGLERWELVEKMGDGAFSNVYRARDLKGEYGEVGIKVVRKYEMNNMQVSYSGLVVPCIYRPLLVLIALFFSFYFSSLCPLHLTNRGVLQIGKQTSSSGL